MNNPVMFTDPSGMIAVIPPGMGSWGWQGPGLTPWIRNIINAASRVRTATTSSQPQTDTDGGGAASPIVFLDPGHGGSDTGASRWLIRAPSLPAPFISISSSSSVVFEKDINLDVALRVRDILQANGVIVPMSRITDVNISPADRARLANESGADLFVSIHHNSSNPFRSGTLVLYPLAERHGSRSAASRVFATNINNMVSANTGLRDLGVQEGNFIVLNQTNMPAIITETGFMGGDLMFLANPDNRQEIAESIAEGILYTLFGN